MKTLSYRLIFALCIGTAWVSLSLARYGGPGYLMNMAATGAPGEITCAACHASTSGGGTLQLEIIQGPSGYQPGATYQLRATLNAPGHLVGGMQIIALETDSSSGLWTPPSGMRTVNARTVAGTNRTYMEHSSPKQANNQGVTSWNFSWQAPSTSGISPIFYAASVAANDDFSPNGDRVFQAFLGLSSLPLEWGDVSVVENHGMAEIQWKTLWELNTASFEIQRSLDGHIFTSIGQEKAKGNNEEKAAYSWLDEQPIYGQAIFYRLKQTDVDGKFTFSEIVHTDLTRVNSGLMEYYPNRLKAGGDIQFLYHSLEPEVLKVTIQELSGKVFIKNQYELTKGTQSATISTAGLRPGWYMLILQQGKTVEARKVLVE